MDVNKADTKYKRSPLLWAIHERRADIAIKLISKGANVNVQGTKEKRRKKEKKEQEKRKQ